jgi:hypothetical protein
MRRVNPCAASSLDWFPIGKGDIGEEAQYFEHGFFEVEKRKD